MDTRAGLQFLEWGSAGRLILFGSLNCGENIKSGTQHIGSKHCIHYKDTKPKWPYNSDSKNGLSKCEETGESGLI